MQKKWENLLNQIVDISNRYLPPQRIQYIWNNTCNGEENLLNHIVEISDSNTSHPALKMTKILLIEKSQFFFVLFCSAIFISRYMYTQRTQWSLDIVKFFRQSPVRQTLNIKTYISSQEAGFSSYPKHWPPLPPIGYYRYFYNQGTV
jgi:hypothetical protein